MITEGDHDRGRGDHGGSPVSGHPEPPTSALGRRWDATLIRVATAVLRRGSPWLDGAADSLLGYMLREAIEDAQRPPEAARPRPVGEHGEFEWLDGSNGRATPRRTRRRGAVRAAGRTHRPDEPNPSVITFAELLTANHAMTHHRIADDRTGARAVPAPRWPRWWWQRAWETECTRARGHCWHRGASPPTVWCCMCARRGPALAGRCGLCEP